MEILLSVTNRSIYRRLPSSPGERVPGELIQIDDSLYFFGGEGIGFVILNELWTYSFLQKTWTQKEVPVEILPRRYHSTTNVGSLIYVIGGENKGVSLTDLLIYDTTNDTWVVKEIPSEIIPLTSCRTFTNLVDEEICIFIRTPSGLFYRYRPTTNEWTTISTNMTAITSDAHTAINGEEYYYGGLVHGTASDKLFKATTDPVTEIILPENGTTPGFIRFGAFTAVDDYIFLYGGLKNNTQINELWVYSISENTWRSLPPGGPLLRNAGLCSYKGKLYSFGGIVTSPTNIPVYSNEFWEIDIIDELR